MTYLPLVRIEEVTSPVNLSGVASVISGCDVNRTIIAAGVVTASILLAACGGAHHTDTANSYTSAEQVAAALAKGGLPCTGAQYGTPVVKGASSEALCNFSSNDLTLIDVFPASHSVTASEVSSNSVSTGSQQIITVYGPNWWVQTDSTYDHRVQKILAGKILAGPWHPSSSSSQSSSPSTTDPAITVCQDFAGIESTLTTDLNTVEANPSAGATGPNSITPLGNTLNKYGDDMSHWSYVVNQAVDNGTTLASVALANDLGDAGIATVQAGVAGETDPGAASSALSSVQSVQSDCSGVVTRRPTP